MGTAWRRTTYIFFFALFFALTPLFIFLALGYRYNFSTHAIQKNGAFYVKSFPRGADIFIDGDKYKSKTPSQVTEVAPDKYILTVSKSGYVTWSKKLEVTSGQTTFAEDIVLWLADRSQTKLGTGGDKYLANHQQNKYAYLDGQYNLHITDLDSSKDFIIDDLQNNFDILDWSNDNQRLLLSLNSRYFIYDINQKQNIELPLESVDKLIWDKKNNDLLWYMQGGKLYRINISDLATPTTSVVNLDPEIPSINAFDLYGDYLLVHYTISGVNILGQLKTDSLSSVTKITELNRGELDVMFADDFRVVFTIGSKLYIKKIFAPLTEIPITAVKIHDERLIFTNGHEVIEYHFGQDWQSLIDRSTQLVSDLAWHPNGSYFISEVNGKTSLIELDGRDKRNTLELLDNPLKKMYLFNEKGDKLFVLTPEENFYITVQ